jgi:hypothetical protein
MNHVIVHVKQNYSNKDQITVENSEGYRKGTDSTDEGERGRGLMYYRQSGAIFVTVY